MELHDLKTTSSTLSDIQKFLKDASFFNKDVSAVETLSSAHAAQLKQIAQLSVDIAELLAEEFEVVTPYTDNDDPLNMNVSNVIDGMLNND